MTPKFARRTLLSFLVLAAVATMPGCAFVFPPEGTITIAAGSSICAGADGTRATNGRCEALQRVADSLHTPEMDRAIAAAQRY